MLTGFASRLRLPCHSIARSSLLSLYKPQESALPDALPAGCRSSHLLAALSRLLVVSLLLLGLGFCLPRAAYANPTVMQGNVATFPATGTDTPQSMWDIVRAGSTVATSSAANGWTVSFNTGNNNFTVGAPSNATIATNYEVRTYSSAGVKSAFFDVIAGTPPALSALSLSPTSVVSGNKSTGTVTLTSSAPAGGISVSLTSNDASATVPSSVTVPSGQSSATFAVNTQGVTTTKTVTISANYNSVTKSAPLTIAPGPTVTALSLAPAGVTGGSTHRTDASPSARPPPPMSS